VIVPQSIATVIAALWAIPVFAEEPRPAQQATKSLEIHSVSVDGKPISWRPGGVLRTKASPEKIALDFGPASNSGLERFRLRYKLEGWDKDWESSGGYMCLTVRFCDEAEDKIAEEAFNVSGESAGWNGSLKNSPLTHRRETLIVPPLASRLWVVISSAGPPSTVGIYVVDNLVISRLSYHGAPSGVLLCSPSDRRTGNGTPNESTVDWEHDRDWQRDGTRPSMAKIVEFGHDPKVKALGILDEDPRSHAEWHNRRETAPRVAPGERLVIEWNEMYSIGVADLKRIAYEKLPAGDFRFRVAEVTAMGTPTGLEASLPIRVPRALWKMEWFWPAVAALLIAAVAAGNRYYAAFKMRRVLARLEYQRMMECDRLRIAQDIHDDLGARVTQISLFSAMAQGNLALPESARADFARISRLSRELISSLYETVWAVNPDNDNMEALGDYLCQMASHLCEPAQLRCRLHIPDLPQNIQISSHVRHHVVMAVKESVHNVIKHARASHVTISVACAERLLAISIQDNGCGFQVVAAGNGLANIKRRMEEIGGDCLIESQSGQGTAIHLRLMIQATSLAAQNGASNGPVNEPLQLNTRRSYEKVSDGS
jgi:signal transduction histidine kinase